MSAERCKKIIKAENAPKAIGPYSVGVITDNLIFTAGQLGIEPGSGNIVDGGIEAETRQALENLSAILGAAGSSLEGVVKTTVFLQDMAEFQKMNDIYANYFTNNPPARSTIQVASLPKGGRVEIEAIAFLCDDDET